MIERHLIAARHARRVAPPTGGGATAPRCDSQAAKRGETLPHFFVVMRLARSAGPRCAPFYAHEAPAISVRARDREPGRRPCRTAACPVSNVLPRVANTQRTVQRRNQDGEAAPPPRPVPRFHGSVRAGYLDLRLMDCSPDFLTAPPTQRAREQTAIAAQARDPAACHSAALTEPTLNATHRMR